MPRVTSPVDRAVVAGGGGLDVEVVSKMLSDAGITVHGDDESNVEPDVVVLVEPRPTDWRRAAARGAAIVVFTQSEVDAPMLTAALRRGARAIIDGDAEVAEVVTAVEMATAGVFLTPEQAALLVEAISGDSGRVDDSPRLSPREAQILASIARGESMKQAARALGISEKTVESLQGRLLLKLGARNRPQAVARAHALGLLPDDAFDR